MGNTVNTSQIRKEPRPAKDLRDQLRRDQIIAAARSCVVRHGFHGATMAEIAAAARMSVGQIYRYFCSKEAIVHAIVEGIVSLRLKQMASADWDDSGDMVMRLMGDASDEERENHVLMLEVTAEATRNSAVADIAKQADQRLHDQAIETCIKACPTLSLPEAAARVELIATLWEGTLFRRVTGLRAAPDALIKCYRDVIDQVLPGRPKPE